VDGEAGDWCQTDCSNDSDEDTVEDSSVAGYESEYVVKGEDGMAVR